MSSHLKEINETYFEHLRFAMWMGVRMVFAGVACILHSIMPEILITTASDTIKTLNQEMHERKNKN